MPKNNPFIIIAILAVIVIAIFIFTNKSKSCSPIKTPKLVGFINDYNMNYDPILSKVPGTDKQFYAIPKDPNAITDGPYYGTYDEILKINNCNYKYAYVFVLNDTSFNIGGSDQLLFPIPQFFVMLFNVLPTSSSLIQSVNSIPGPPTGYSTKTGKFIDNPSYTTTIFYYIINSNSIDYITYMSIYQLY